MMPRGVNGHVEPGFEPVARQFADLFRSRGRGGGSFAVRYQDRFVVDIWGGFADPESGRPWARDSLGLSFSTSKGVAATVIHRLADRGLLSYDEPVAAFWPQFAAGGKSQITVAQLMSHQAGLDRLAPIAPNVERLLDHVGAEERLAARAPDHPPGSPAYHAITFGWLMSGLARAVTGQGMQELLRSEICEPLGIDGLFFGRPAAPAGRTPALVGSLGRLATIPPLGLTLLPAAIPGRRGLESVYVPDIHGIFTGSEPAILDTTMPAANGMFTAESLSTVYAALANDGVAGGRRLVSTQTARALRRVQTRARDRNLVIPMFWRLGYHQAFVPGISLPRAFGHYGLCGSGAWADPESGMSAAFVTNRIYPLSTPFGDLALVRLSRTAVRCARRLPIGLPSVRVAA
jgi:CubicO group peptidase (beta-lactamase class C family)